MKSALYEKYVAEIRPQLAKDLDIKNPMNIPMVDKVVINVGMGTYLRNLNKKDYSFVTNNIERITGQKPVVRHAKLSVSNFKLREGQPVGMVVTLRKQAAYNFLYKMFNIAYPRVRDFRGVKRDIFDKHGNCSFGFNDHTVFPEGVQPENSREIHGLQVTVVTTASEEKGARALMESLGFPFQKQINTQS